MPGPIPSRSAARPHSRKPVSQGRRQAFGNRFGRKSRTGRPSKVVFVRERRCKKEREKERDKQRVYYKGIIMAVVSELACKCRQKSQNKGR